MSQASRTEYATRTLLEMQAAIESGDKKAFLELLTSKKTGLHNATVGDAYLEEKYIAILRQGLEKFISA